jgi:sugar phosphate isomerase/epimerase
MSSSAARDFGVQSYCFRNFKDNKKVAELVRQIGLNKIEVCGVHANFEDPDGFAKVNEIYKQAGVDIISIGVQTFTGDAQKERKWMECAKIAGAKHISAHVQVPTFQTALPATAKMAAEFGIRIGLHCHGGYMFGGSPDVIDYLLKIGGNQVGLCIDTAWCMQIGPKAGQPIQWVRERYKGRIYGIHYKDFTFDSKAMWTDVVVGTGNLDLPGFVKALDETQFNGMAVIEYEADPENPVPALTECVKKMRQI